MCALPSPALVWRALEWVIWAIRSADGETCASLARDPFEYSRCRRPETRNLSSISIALLVFAFVFGGVVLGMILRVILPEHHLSPATNDSVKIAMGFVATMSALILGLLVASAKEAYDIEKDGVTEMAAEIIVLDRVLANYGPETKEARELLRRFVERSVHRMWPDKASESAQLDPTTSPGEAMFASIQQLSPQNDLQRALKSEAWTTTMELTKLRWLEFEQARTTISMPLLSILTFWRNRSRLGQQ